MEEPRQTTWWCRISWSDHTILGGVAYLLLTILGLAEDSATTFAKNFAPSSAAVQAPRDWVMG